MIPLTVIIVALLVFVVWREHQLQTEREAWTRERGLLLNRIKPETAQAPDMPEQPMFQPRSLEDDEAYWAMQEQS